MIMKKLTTGKIILILLLLIVSNCISAQDTIFTKTGDTLLCKINKMEKSSIFYTQTKGNEAKNMFLSMNNVLRYHSTGAIEYNTKKGDYPKFRLAFDGGYSRRTKKIDKDTPEEFVDYYKELMNGINLGCKLNYFASRQFGFGVKYSHFRSQNAMFYYSTASYYGSSYSYESIINEDINIDFLGATFDFRTLHNKNRNSFTTYMGAGYLMFLDRVLSAGIKAKSKTIGLTLGVNYDIKIFENVAVGVDFSYIMGSISKWVLSDGVKSENSDLSKKNNLNHLNLTVGIQLIK